MTLLLNTFFARFLRPALLTAGCSSFQNYPNPFNPTTTIGFTISSDGRVVLKVYDVLGKEVTTLVDKDLKAGEYQQVAFDGSRFASGVYFARLEFGGKQLLKKMVLMK